jgi:hypothetical protein
MAIRRGNPNWGKTESFAATPKLLTAFEQTVRDFNLQPEQYRQSEALREWAQRNCSCKYIPESLLKAWGICNKA